MTIAIGELLYEVQTQLAEAGIENPRLDARVLLGNIVDGGEATVFGYPEREVPAVQVRKIRALAARRAAREPMSQVLGEKEFWSLGFEVTGDTLTPRPDTETLIEAMLAWAGRRNGRPLRILDLGTGSGCILLTLLHAIPDAQGLGVDCSAAALGVARRNADRLGLSGRARFQQGNWTDGIDERFDLVVANPPYIPTGDIGGLDPEVARFEPLVALDGGLDGLVAYRRIAQSVGDVLAPDGAVFLEVGAGQAPEVARLLGDAGLADVSVRADLSGLDRCVCGFQPTTVA